MEKNKKELKILSWVILVLALFAVVNNIVELCISGLPTATPPEGLTVEVVKVISIIGCVIGFLVYIPQIFVGVQGIRVADGAKAGKAHIVWAIVLAVFAGISAVSGFCSFASGFTASKLASACMSIVDVMVYVYYIIYARKIAQ